MTEKAAAVMMVVGGSFMIVAELACERSFIEIRDPLFHGMWKVGLCLLLCGALMFTLGMTME